MRTIGLIGGMSWESTVVYYQHLNRLARARLGGLASAQVLMWSVDFAQIAALQAAGDWDRLGDVMADAALRLKAGGADCIVICTNTMHKLAHRVDQAGLPLIHIADVTAAAVRARDGRRPLLLATRYTMEQDFYRGRLQALGLDPIVPDAPDRTTVHDIIYNELCQGVIRPEARAAYLDIIARTPDADGVILGCTEIGLLIGARDTDLPVYDTTLLHAQAALDFALADEKEKEAAHG